MSITSSNTAGASASDSIHLTSNGASSVGANAWVTSPLRFNDFFHVTFAYSVSNYQTNKANLQSEGFAFVLLDPTAQLSAAQGTGSVNLGYNLGQAYSLAVEFDMHYDGVNYDPSPSGGGTAPTTPTDYACNHVEVHGSLTSKTNGPTVSARLYPTSSTTEPAWLAAHAMVSGAHLVDVEYQAGYYAGGTGLLSVWIDSSLILQYAVSDAAISSMFANNTAYFGWAASTGTDSATGSPISADTYIYNISLYSNLASPQYTRVTLNAGTTAAITASSSAPSTASSATAAINVRAYDYCNRAFPISAGVFSTSMTSAGAAIGNAVVVDWRNGNYSVYAWYTAAAGGYTLSLSNNQRALAKSPYPLTVLAGPVAASTTTYTLPSGSLQSMTAGTPLTCVVTVRDAYGNPNATANLGAYDLAITINNPGAGTTDYIYPSSFSGAVYTFQVATTTASKLGGSGSLTLGAVYLTLLSSNIVNSPVTNVLVSEAAVSAANCTLGGNFLITITAGATATVVLQPSDVYGNPIRSVLNGSLTLTGQATGVAVTSTQQWLQSSSSSAYPTVVFTFVATVADTYHLVALVGPSMASLVRVPDTRTPTVIASTVVNATRSSFYGLANGTAGYSSSNPGVTFSIASRDAFGNAFTTSNGPSYVYTIAVNSPPTTTLTATCIDSGTPSPAADIANVYGQLTCSYSQSSATYSVKLAAYNASRPYTVAVTMDGASVPANGTSPSTFLVSASTASAAQSDFSLLSTALSAGSTGYLRVFVSDQYGNPRVGVNDIAALWNTPIAFVSPSSGTVSASVAGMNTTLDGTYTQSFVPITAATYSVSVQIAGAALAVVSGGSNSIVVIPGAFVPSRLQTSGAGTAGGVTATNQTITLQPFDGFGNQLQTAVNPAVAFFVNVSTAASWATGTVVQNVDATGFQSYTLTYTVPAFVVNASTLTIRVYNSSASGTLCTTIIGQVLTLAVDNATAVLPSHTVTAGTVSVIQVTPRGANSVPQYNTDVFTLNLVNSSTNASIPLNFPAPICVNVSSTPGGGCALWNFTLDPTVAGTYRLQVLVTTATQSSESVQSAGGIGPLAVVPAAVSAARSTATAVTASSLSAGSTFTFKVVCYDGYNNAWHTSPGVAIAMLSSAIPVETPSYGPVVTDNHDGSYTISVAYTTAGYRTLAVSIAGQAMATQLPLTYTPAPFNGSMSTFTLTSATAGSAVQGSVNAIDAYGNALTTALLCSVSFTRSFDGAVSTFDALGGSTLSNYLTVSARGSGVYGLSLTALSLADYSAPLSVTVSCGASAASTRIALAQNVSVAPSTLSDRLSSIVNWPSAAITSASTLTLSLSLYDLYGNPWGALTTSSYRALFSATIARNTLLNVQSAPGTIAPVSSAVGSGRFTVTYVPTLASTSYTFVFLDELSVQHTFNRTTFTVVAQSTPAPAKTTLTPSPLSQTMVAGVMSTVSLQFADLYGNPINPVLLNSSLGANTLSATPITAAFYVRSTTAYCVNGAIDASQPVSARFNSSGLALSADHSTILLNFTTGVVGTYYVMVYVGGAPILSACSSLPARLGFAVVHAPVYLPGSLVSQGNGGTLRAGAALALSIQLVDAFNNSIIDLPSSTSLTAPNSTSAALCTSTLPVFPWNGAVDTISAPAAGAFLVSFTATVAGTYILPFTLGGSLVGQSSSCPSITILPSYMYSFTKGAEPAVVAGVQSSFVLSGVDVYGNAISAANLVGVFTAAFVYAGSASQPPFTFSTVSAISALSSQPVITYYADLAGNYSVTVTIPADPSDPSQHVPAPLSYTVTVAYQSCAAQTGNAALLYRCPSDHSCVTSYSQCAGFVECPLGTFIDVNGATVCLSGYPPATLCPVGTSLCALPSTSPSATALLQANALSFFCSVVCPTGWLSDRFAVDCGNGVMRRSLADCPSVQVCPFGYRTCPDGSCVQPATNCSFSTTVVAQGAVCASTGGVQCRDGRCAQRAENCATPRTCGLSEVLCADGSCQVSVDACPNSYSCAAVSGAGYRCSSGECRTTAADCPSLLVCPASFVLCPAGECAPTLAQCAQNGTACASGFVRCTDGSCRSNTLQCPTILTCPASASVHCGDNSCAADIALCPALPACSSPTPFVCPDGTCSINGTTCSSGITCPPTAPVLCADHSCAPSLLACGMAFSCPPSQPIRCADGACKGATEDCSSALICPAAIPVRCPDGSCAISVLACPNPSIQLTCASTQIRCPSGHCAAAITDCPTTVSCSAGLDRCADGTCRPSCDDSLALTAYSFCAAGQILCPRTSAGVACAPSLALCPTEMTCPSGRPVRCVDNSCAPSAADCPVVTSVISDQYLTSPCVGGGWKDSFGSCGTSVTCPAFAPIKCWDESCRVTADDCPPQVACTFGTTNAPSFLCPDGSCHSTPSACSSLIQCTYPQVKCPSDTAGGAGVFCVSSVSQCVNLFQASSPTAVCPNSYTRCRAGNCMPSVQSCPGFTCPQQLPYACPSGVCAASNATCPAANGCPADSPAKCWDGSCVSSALLCSASVPCPVSGQMRCADGSCSNGNCYSPSDSGCPASQVRCWDKNCAASWSDCTDASDAYNACPAARPYRCADGYCAVTKSACPVFPAVAASFSCPAGRPVLCADGSCTAFGSQCPALFPCAVGTARCGDGSCRISGACPAVNTCPAARPLRCQSGLCVSASVSALTTFLESTTTSDPNCIDEATRDGLTSGVQDSRGCPYGLQKCLNGACSTQCAATTAGVGVAALVAYMYPNGLANGCPTSTPIKCYDGSCADVAADCPATTGCPSSTPVLCGDGSCQASLSACSAATSCVAPNAVQCPNGQCASSYALCQAANNCPVTSPLRCANGQCAMYPAHVGSGSEQSLNGSSVPYSLPPLASTCPPTVTCDTQNGFLCADLRCVASADKCRPLQPCPSAGQQYCTFTAACVAVGQQCPQQNASFCPPSNPVLCANGACVTSTAKCVSPYSPLLSATATPCAASQVQCFDGSCQASYPACFARANAALATSGSAPFDINASVMNDTCAEVGQFPCANGLCAWTQSAAAMSICPPIPACTAAYPVRCADGSCIADTNTTSCAVLGSCEAGAVRCGDGSCRPTASQCVPLNGCPASLPFFCPGARSICVASITQCASNVVLAASQPSGRRLLQTTAAVAGSAVCAENCDRDVVAQVQDVSVSNAQSVVIDVSVDSAYVVGTQVVIPAGALDASVTVFSVAPVATSTLSSSATPFSSTVLSTPFSCSTDQPTLPFIANLTINAAVDLQLPSSSASSAPSTSASSTITTPCALITGTTASFAVAPYTANGENSTCTGSLQLTATAIDLVWTTGCTAPDQGLTLTGTLQSTTSSSQAAGFIAGYGATCLCYNVTASSSGAYPAGSMWCAFASHASATSPYIAAWSIASASTRCPGPLESAASNHFVALSPPASLALSCTTATSDVNAISASDICLGAFNAATATWSCVYGDYYYRLANPPWSTTTGRATNRMQSPLPACTAAAYAYMYSPQVQPAPPAGPSCDLWCQYEALILGLSIGITVFLAVSAYIIWRLIRYRRKYLANKKENHALSARARHLDEYAGGLGLADEEVDMVGNPLVIEMKALDERIARLSKGGPGDDSVESEKQLRLIREMEDEKKRLYAEILRLREQVKAKTTAAGPKGPSRASLYMRQQVSPFAPVRLSFDGEGAEGQRRGSSSEGTVDLAEAGALELMTEDTGVEMTAVGDTANTVVAPTTEMDYAGRHGEVTEGVEALPVAMPEQEQPRADFGPNQAGGGRKKMDL